MIKRFPRAERYLEAEHWPTRQSWATPWVRTRFTADTRTTGRVESENSVNKLLGNRKTSLSDLFQSLVQRAAQQAQPSKLAAYLLQRETATESHFRDILDRLRAHCDIWVVKRAVAEMEHASFYEAKAVNLGDLPSISELVGENSGCQDKDAPVPPPVVKEDEVEDLNELPSDALGRAELDAAYLLEMLRSLGFNIVRGYQLRRITKLGARIVFVATTAQFFLLMRHEHRSWGPMPSHLGGSSQGRVVQYGCNSFTMVKKAGSRRYSDRNADSAPSHVSYKRAVSADRYCCKNDTAGGGPRILQGRFECS
ncbi:hypothetical protein V8E36_009761 [Tilletia maclaganii]